MCIRDRWWSFASVVVARATVVVAKATVVVSSSMEQLFVTKLVPSSAEDVVERYFRFNAFHVGSAIVRCGGGGVCGVWWFP